MKSKFFFLIFILTTCILFNLSGQDSLLVKPDTVSGNNTILIINSFDAMSMEARKNKKELFAELTNRLKQILYDGIQAQGNMRAIVAADLLADTVKRDSSVFSLMKTNNASKAIVIKKVNAYFVQTRVDVVKESDGKKRTAYYDICSTVTYSLYNRNEKTEEREKEECEYFTDRSVVSGLLAAGPDIVGKSKHAFKIVEKNAMEYLKIIFFTFRSNNN